VAPVSTSGTVSIVGSAGQDVLIGDIDNSNTITGGAGVDTITGGSAADSLSGGEGIDSITGGGGNDTIVGGEGNDILVQTIASADSMSVDGGAGNDLLTLTGFDLVTSEDVIAGGADIADVLTVAVVNASAGGGANVIGWETLVITTAGAASQAMTTVLTGDTTINRIDFTGAANAAQGVTNASANLATLRSVSNSNTLSVARAVNTTNDTLTFGAATDAVTTVAVLTVNNEETLNFGQGAITTTTNTSTITSLNAIQATTINVTGASPMVVTAVGTSASATGFGTTARSITVNAGTATNTVIFGAGTALATQPLTMTGSSSAANTLTGGLGADTLTGGSAADSLTGGAGIDSLTGNLGADTLTGDAGNDVLTGGEDADVYSGGTGWDTLTLTEVSSAADRVNITTAVGGVSDSFGQAVSGLANDTGGDTITGFTWVTDTIRLTATDVVTFVHGTNTAIGTAGDVNDGSLASFVTSVGLVNFGGTATTVFTDTDDVAINFASPSATMTEALFEAALQYVITGTAAANTITGGGLDDTITGGAGADTITVGAGTDVVQLASAAGAAGGDTLAFVAAANNTARTTVAMDKISGMAAGDTIKLTTAYTGAAGAAAGLIALATATNTMASDAGNTLIPNGISVVRGTFDAAAATFVGAAAGVSSMVIYDSDATVGTEAFEVIILVGYIGTITGGAAGVMTLG
jgi:Ca2+-binding RTX toxin-like protein